MFTFINSNLPGTVPPLQNFFAPVSKLRLGTPPSPLLTIKTFYKYPGVNPEFSEITTPDATYNLYRVDIPFLDVLGVGIDGFIQVLDVNRLNGQRFFIQDSAIYFTTNTIPVSYQIKIGINAPIPLTPCELITSVPAGLEVDQITLRGVPLNFGQVGQQLTIDCSDSCCRVRGGEILGVEANFSTTPLLINQIHVFNISEDVGLIDYIEWRGKRFVAYEDKPKSGQFLWDSRANSLKLIV